MENKESYCIIIIIRYLNCLHIFLGCSHLKYLFSFFSHLTLFSLLISFFFLFSFFLFFSPSVSPMFQRRLQSVDEEERKKIFSFSSKFFNYFFLFRTPVEKIQWENSLKNQSLLCNKFKGRRRKRRKEIKA